jgi:hypothetical protein
MIGTAVDRIYIAEIPPEKGWRLIAPAFLRLPAWWRKPRKTTLICVLDAARRLGLSCKPNVNDTLCAGARFPRLSLWGEVV